MDCFGMAATKELGSLIETDILRNFVSGVRVNDPKMQDTEPTKYIVALSVSMVTVLLR